MDAKPLSIGKIFTEKQRFVVPVYQRTYAWTVKRQLDALFEQIVEKAKERLSTGKVAFSHYMGALLLIPVGEPVFGKIQVFNVVDGQQRLTTFHLLFAALHRTAMELGFHDIATQLAQLVLIEDGVPLESRDERYKLRPTGYDRQLFRDLIDLDRDAIRSKYPEQHYKNGKPLESAEKPLLAYSFFRHSALDFIRDIGEERQEDQKAVHRSRLLALSTVLYEDFKLIVITLSKEDDAQVIFETLNSAGEPLAAMDLVRNDVFHRAIRQGEDETAILQQWSVFEDQFWKTDQVQGRIKKPRIDFFLAHVLSAETGTVPLLSELYAEYKRFVAARNFKSTSEELAVLLKYMPAYRQLIDPPAQGEIARLAKRLSTFDVTTAYPLVLTIATEIAPDEVKDRLYLLVSSYIIRRALCGLPPKAYNRIFVDLAATLKQRGLSEDIFHFYFSSRATAETVRFPSDDELRVSIASRPVYERIQRSRLRLILEELEFSARDRFNVHGTLQDSLSIEHIMPQSWEGAWPLQDGTLVTQRTTLTEEMRKLADARRVLVDALPNLTLLTPPANSSAGNQNFEQKKARLNDSLLKYNVDIASEPVWNEEAIGRQALKIHKLALSLWPAPRSN